MHVQNKNWHICRFQVRPWTELIHDTSTLKKLLYKMNKEAEDHIKNLAKKIKEEN
jgi:hypothetical protein